MKFKAAARSCGRDKNRNGPKPPGAVWLLGLPPFIVVCLIFGKNESEMAGFATCGQSAGAPVG